MEASRKKLDESGYCYRKGKSRSRQLSTNDGKECLEKKRAKISKEIRLSRITELQEQIKDKNEQVQYKDLRREAAKNVHNYKECDKLTEQMSVLKSDRRGLELELAALTKKQKKSEWYFNRTSTPLKVSAALLLFIFPVPLRNLRHPRVSVLHGQPSPVAVASTLHHLLVFRCHYALGVLVLLNQMMTLLQRHIHVRVMILSYSVLFVQI